jgi:hypothetical protein
MQELYLLVRDAGIRTYVVGQFISGALQNRILPFPEKTQSEYVSVKEVLTRRREDEGELEAGTSRSKFAKAKRARKLKRAKLLKPKKSKGDDEQTAEDEKQKDEIEEEEADEDDVKEVSTLLHISILNLCILEAHHHVNPGRMEKRCRGQEVH